MIFNVAELDVWGNAEDGFDVNNVYRTDRYIDVKDTKVETLTEALKKWYNLPAFIFKEQSIFIISVNGKSG